MSDTSESNAKRKIIEDTLSVTLEKYIDSPVKYGYRNNQLYIFGRHAMHDERHAMHDERHAMHDERHAMHDERHAKYDIGLYVAKKTIEIDPCENDLNGSYIAKCVARTVYNWAMMHPELDVIDKDILTGFWRSVFVRETRGGDVALTITVLSNNTSLINIWTMLVPDFCKTIDDYCTSQGWNLCNIYVQYTPTLKSASPTDPFIEIFNKCEFIDKLDKFKFRRSPDSFFQPNTHTALIIYDYIRELVLSHKETTLNSTLLDICCGTGTIGIYVSSLFKQIIGIDRTAGSIDDARYNAILNNCSNCIYYVGDAEVIVPKVVSDYDLKHADTFAIVNPPRRGLYDPVLKALNECDNIKTLIYISCNVHSLKRDMQLLKFKTLKHIIAVDQFPNTEHCEVIIELEL